MRKVSFPLSLVLCAAWLAATLSACQTAADAELPAGGGKTLARPEAALPVRIQNDTVLPPSFAAALPPEAAKAVVPAGMLLVSKVSRPRAELRSGPGAQFEVADTVLPQDTLLLTFGRIGVWQKVLVVGSWKSGWVHTQAVSAPAPSTRPIVVATHALPTVMVMHEVDSVQAFNGAKELQAHVPKGALFRSLRLAEAGTLVWLPQTNSVMWMSRKDVQ